MELFNYLLEVSACSALFFAFYLLVLRKLTFFKINRFYLLFSVAISFIIPALQFTIEREVEAPIQIVANASPNNGIGSNQNAFSAPITISSIQVEGTGSFNWLDVLPSVYGLIVFGLLLIAAWRLFQLLKHTNAPVKEVNGLKLVTKRNGFTNCSFFNYVFIDEKSLTETELAVLLSHEEVHAKQYHSVDKLLMMVTKAFLWFNPVIYLYDKALEQMHEYEADEATSRNVGTESYATLLLKLAVSKSSSPLIHNFVKSPIKERIKMLFNSKSNNMKKLAYLLALPIGLGLVWLLATEVVYAKTNMPFNQDKPFIERATKKDAQGYVYEKITINSPGKPLQTGIGFYSKKAVVNTLWFFINDKLYTEAEAQKFDAAFVKGLSSTKGFAGASEYNIPGVDQNYSNYVFWFGKEPKLSDNTSKNRAVYQKYNGTTVTGTVVEYSYSPKAKTVMDGFILKTNDGVLLKAFVEAKFVKQANAMVKAGDKITVKIYNASYWKDTKYPILTSFKLLKDDKVLFDRWPKTASINFKVKGSEAKIEEVYDLNKLRYSANDSTITNKNFVYLYGSAEVSLNNITYRGSRIIYDNEQNTLRVSNASIYDRKSNTTVKADSMHVDLKSSKGVIFGKVIQHLD